MDIIESALAPMHDYFDLYKKCYNHYYYVIIIIINKLDIFFPVMHIKTFVKKL